MTTALWIVGGVLGLFLLLGLVQLAVVRWARRRAERIVASDYAGCALHRIDPLANQFGRRSRGLLQVRGNGLLLLLDDRIAFHPLARGENWEIPLERILGLSDPRVFLGKTYLRPLLAIRFRDDEGEEDEAAWAVRDPEGWRRDIEARRV
ncbi:MAG: hypothetical protein R3F20_05120 [Planctomycetota bacterium]